MRGDAEARVVDRGGSTYVVLDELPVLPAGRTYQLWSLEAGAPATSLGLLGPGGAQAVPVTLPRGTSEVAVSNEPAGGSPAPSHGMIAAAGSLSRPA
jgi:anti-sigma-K factor RskA